MNYGRCKCGKIESYDSYGSYADCNGCEECKTTLALHPSLHKELKPHEWKEKYNQNTGKKYKVCTKCGHLDIESFKLSEIKD